MKLRHTIALFSAPDSLRHGAPDRPVLDADRLAHMQRILGHKDPEATLAFYAEFDENLALDRWQAHLAEKKSRQPTGWKKKGLR